MASKSKNSKLSVEKAKKETNDAEKAANGKNGRIWGGTKGKRTERQLPFECVRMESSVLDVVESEVERNARSKKMSYEQSKKRNSSAVAYLILLLGSVVYTT